VKGDYHKCNTTTSATRRSIQDEYEQVGAEKFAAQSHKRRSSMLGEGQRASGMGMGGRFSETLRNFQGNFQDRSHVYDGTVPAAVHGAPHTLQVRTLGPPGGGVRGGGVFLWIIHTSSCPVSWRRRVPAGEFPTSIPERLIANTRAIDRQHLGDSVVASPCQMFCGVPTASHPHPWLVPYLHETDTSDIRLLVVYPYVP